ncbi:MAG: TRAP transporter large permease [Thermodesulfobacteriota bacterium]
MDSSTVGALGLIVMLGLMALGMPIAFAMALVGAGGYVWLAGLKAGLSLLGMVPFSTAFTYTFSVIPLFILMGQFAFHAGLVTDLYRTANVWLGRLPGGLAMATIGASAGFAAVSGSSTAAAATIGTVCIPEMRRHDYAPSLSAGSAAAGGTLAIMIPPSMLFIIYCSLVEESVGKLFIAGIIPGIVLSLLFILAIYLTVRMDPWAGPRGAKTTILEKMISLRKTWEILTLFFVVMGGIYAGLFTPTEAAAVGAFGSFIFAVGKRRLTFKNLTSSLLDTGRTTAMIFALLIAAGIFSNFLAISQLPVKLTGFVTGLAISKYIIFSGICSIYLALGCIMSSIEMIIITLPIFYPMILSLGFDPIWFGVVTVAMVEVGVLTPPVGINVYVISGTAKDIPLYTIFRGVTPFVLSIFLLILLLTLFPQLTLFLPRLMR